MWGMQHRYQQATGSDGLQTETTIESSVPEIATSTFERLSHLTTGQEHFI